jgi:hypothetical protein
MPLWECPNSYAHSKQGKGVQELSGAPLPQLQCVVVQGIEKVVKEQSRWAGMLQEPKDVKTIETDETYERRAFLQEIQAMKRVPKFLTFAAILAGVAVSVLLMAGCSDNPLAPVVSGSGSDAIQFVESHYGSDPLEALKDSTQTPDGSLAKGGNWCLASASDTAYVGEAGGTICLNFCGSSSVLKIPPKAVCSDDDDCVVMITARATHFTTPYGPLFLYDFGPDGLTFAKPCELEVNAGFPPGKIVSLFWLNPATHAWELQQQVKVLNHGEVKFTVTHFSKYGIS